VLTGCCVSAGYKLGEKKTAEELAALDAEDESLAKWKASLGIGAGGSAHVPASGSQVRLQLGSWARSPDTTLHGPLRC
jgi:RHO protein GDP dissociation inhibitor